LGKHVPPGRSLPAGLPAPLHPGPTTGASPLAGLVLLAVTWLLGGPWLLVGCASQSSVPQPPQSFRSAVPLDKIAIVCHRNSDEYVPPNTYAACRRCFEELHAAYVEADLRTSVEGQLYLMYDATLDVTPDQVAPLGGEPRPLIESPQAGRALPPDYNSRAYPLLENFLRWLDGQGGLVLDVQDGSPEEIAETIKWQGLEDRVLVFFDKEEDARRFHDVAPEQLLGEEAESLAGVYVAVQQNYAHVVRVPVAYMSDDIATACRKLGVRLMISVQDESYPAYRAAALWGPDIVDVPYTDVFQSVIHDLAAEAASTSPSPASRQ
jgi:hypothetical protein